MGPGVVARRIEERQGHQGDCGSNGQGADEAHEEANEAREAHQHLDTGGNHDRSLQLKRKSGAHRLRARGEAGPAAGRGLRPAQATGIRGTFRGRAWGKAGSQRNPRKASSDLTPLSSPLLPTVCWTFSPYVKFFRK